MSPRHHTGIIICSRLVKPGWPPAAALQQASRTVNQRMKENLITAPRWYFGNELIGVAKDLTSAVAIMLGIEEELVKGGHSSPLKWVLLNGRIQTGRDAESGPEGADLDTAREMLFELSKEKQRFLFHSGKRKTDFLLQEAVKLYSHFTGSWKPAGDRRILSIFLEGHDYKVAAEELDIARPQAWKKYRSLKMDEYFAVRNLMMNLPQIRP